jgi:transposase-like protein
VAQDSATLSEDRIALEGKTGLEELLREGARRMLQTAVEAEVARYIEAHRELKDEHGHRLVVRNGSLPERDLRTGLGPIRVKQPRIHDRREGHRFTSEILPKCLRRAPSIDALVPILYLKGISTGDFAEALTGLLGEGAKGLSATNVVRLKEVWQKDYEAWQKRSLQGKRYVYWWADGLYFNVRLEPDRPCLLILLGATEDGQKELVGLWDGQRESKQSWLELMRDLKARGLEAGPKLSVGDGALGFWAALEEAFPKTRPQRCWVHKTMNVLDCLPKSVQPHAKGLLHEMYLSPTRDKALDAYERFTKHYGAKYPKAVECLSKDKEVLFTFYDFPAEHWVHLRTGNPIESTFGTVRHRTRQTKGCGSRLATLTMVFKLSMEAEKNWRRLNGSPALLLQVMRGDEFVDGELKQAA